MSNKNRKMEKASSLRSRHRGILDLGKIRTENTHTHSMKLAQCTSNTRLPLVKEKVHVERFFYDPEGTAEQGEKAPTTESKF